MMYKEKIKEQLYLINNFVKGFNVDRHQDSFEQLKYVGQIGLVKNGDASFFVVKHVGEVEHPDQLAYFDGVSRWKDCFNFLEGVVVGLEGI